jgi:uncharacterized protein
VATKRAFIHAVQALLASHDEYESGKWRSRAIRLLDPEELPFDQYWGWKLLVTVPMRYLRPSHHPSAEASAQMAMDYLEHSRAARAARERTEDHQQSTGSEG